MSNLRRIYVESTSNLRRIYVESTSNLRRICVESTSKHGFWPRKNHGAFFEREKKPCGNGRTQFLGFQSTRPIFGAEKTRDAFWGVEKAPAGSTRTHTLVLGKDRSRTSPSRSSTGRGTCAHPRSGNGSSRTQCKYLGKGSNLPLQSSPGFEPVPPGCVVRVPTHWAI